MKGIHGDQGDLPLGTLGMGRDMLPGFLLPALLRTPKSFGICTQEVLEDLYSASASRLCMMRLRGQGWKEGKYPSPCISICWEPSLASRQGKEPG